MADASYVLLFESTFRDQVVTSPATASLLAAIAAVFVKHRIARKAMLTFSGIAAVLALLNFLSLYTALDRCTVETGVVDRVEGESRVLNLYIGDRVFTAFPLIYSPEYRNFDELSPGDNVRYCSDGNVIYRMERMSTP